MFDYIRNTKQFPKAAVMDVEKLLASILAPGSAAAGPRGVRSQGPDE
jgi:hypothetical protein